MSATYYKVSPENEPSEKDVLAHMNMKYSRFQEKSPDLYPEASRAEFMEDSEEFDYCRGKLRLRVAEPLDTIDYHHDLTSYGDLMTVQEWLECCESGGFIDYDGHGAPVKDGKRSDMRVWPSLKHLLPKDATHIEWYNR